MKKLTIISILAVAVSALSFVSYNTTEKPTSNQPNEMTVLKGAEKSGYSESNLGSL